MPFDQSETVLVLVSHGTSFTLHASYGDREVQTSKVILLKVHYSLCLIFKVKGHRADECHKDVTTKDYKTNRPTLYINLYIFCHGY